jgi:hypothetical protein
MTDVASHAESARFVAYSTLTREPVLAHADVAELLARTRTDPALGYDNRFVEVLDCGTDGPDAAQVVERLDAARDLYRTVFRGAGALGRPGMPAFPLVGLPAPEPDRVATRALEGGLSDLVARARTAGQPRLASILDRALAEMRAEIARAEATDREDDQA